MGIYIALSICGYERETESAGERVNASEHGPPTKCKCVCVWVWVCVGVCGCVGVGVCGCGCVCV